jgi:hypothetical protein
LRRWLTEIVSAEETSTQVELAFTDALEREGLLELVERRHADGRVDLSTDDQSRPILLAVSDNGPQMTSGSTREFLALCAIAQHFGRPGTPTDQAWIESLNGHLKAEYPHLLAIRDPATLRAELKIVRAHYNGVRLHQNIGYVTPNDEHERRGEAIRKQRQAGLEQARLRRLAWHRQHRHDQPIQDPDDVGQYNAILYREVRNTSAMPLNVVVLPAPLRPSSAAIDPSGTSRDSSCGGAGRRLSGDRFAVRRGGSRR